MEEPVIDFLPKINIITKLAIKYGDSFYMTKAIFAFSENDWFTDNINEIPDNMLFDNYKEAENCLMFISKYHTLVDKYMSIDVVRKLVTEDIR